MLPKSVCPNSDSSPSTWFDAACLPWITSSRIRCMANAASCSAPFHGTGRNSGRRAASAMSAASFASFF
jgi:hypothetical protein